MTDKPLPNITPKTQPFWDALRAHRVDIQQSGVSRHLGILARAGFVNVRPDGQKRYYSLRAEPFEEIDQWVAQFRATWEARLDRFEAALKKRRKK